MKICAVLCHHTPSIQTIAVNILQNTNLPRNSFIAGGVAGIIHNEIVVV